MRNCQREVKLMRKWLVVGIIFLFFGVGFIPCLYGRTIPSFPFSLNASRQIGSDEQKKLLDNFASASLFFTQNQGQFPAEVLFQTQIAGATVYFCKNKIITVFTRESGSAESLDLNDNRNSMLNRMLVNELQQIEIISTVAEFIGANPDVVIKGEDRLLHCTNYFIGNDPLKWHTDVPNYQGITYQDVYPNVDLTYFGAKDGGLKYDFIVHPGADVSRIQVRYTGIDELSVTQNGALRVDTNFGVISEKIPFVYQNVDGVTYEIQGRYAIREANIFGFAIDEYNQLLPLVIDPELAYSTYLGGGNKDSGRSIAVDDSGNAYVVGTTYSYDFPVENPYDDTYGGNGWGDVFITKFSPTGNALVYSTYLGGSDDDFGFGIAVDNSGNAYVVGDTDSVDFPVKNPYDDSLNYNDAFVTKLSPSGNMLLYSTYLGGNGYEEGFGIAVDNSGNAYVVGDTDSVDFPVENPYDDNLSYYDAFVTKLSPSGDTLVYSTYLGGSDGEVGYGIVVDDSGSAYLIGRTKSVDFPIENPYDSTYNGRWDVFVSKLSPSGNMLFYSTYLGGTDDESWYNGYGGIAIDGSGNAYVVGTTYSYNFPLKNPYDSSIEGYNDVFVSKFSPTGETLVYSTYLGGQTQDFGYGIAVNDSGNAYVVGTTYSYDFPMENPYDGRFNGWCDVFVTKFSPIGNALVYSTYLGGSAYEVAYGGIAIDGSGDAYMTGITKSDDFPMENPYDGSINGGYDAFVTKLISNTVNQPPNPPTISGPSSGKAKTAYDFTFNSVDPNDDEVRFIVNWGDGEREPTSFVASGNDITVSHSWSENGTYTIIVYTEDEHSATSSTRTVQMIIDKSKTINSPFLNWLQSHPNIFPIIQLLLQRFGLQ
jgi:hypothetical protein